MRTFTNMAWPDDPYGTGQLWRQEPRLLAGFAIAGAAADQAPAAYAVVYLRLRRAKAVDLTAGVSFGFRAAAAVTGDDAGELIRLLDLDTLRARRLAKVVAGFALGCDLQTIITAAGDYAGRGLRGLADAWDLADRSDRGMAQVFDIADQYPQHGTDLATAAAAAGIDRRTLAYTGATDAAAGEIAAEASSQTALHEPDSSAERLAAAATERALACALTASRLLGSHIWDGLIDISEALASNTWDCYPSQHFGSAPPDAQARSGETASPLAAKVPP